MDSVVVVGAGWAGLACAVRLVEAGCPVTVFETGAEAGGRARRVDFDGAALDNGQHLLLGAYHRTLALMATVGADPAKLLLRLPLELRVRSADGPPVHLRAPRLPAPLHLAAGLLSCTGLGATERIGALVLALRAALAGFHCDRDNTVAQWLRDQPERVRRSLWEPLCLAALNTPVERASAATFLRVLEDSFNHHRSDSDLLIPAADLGAVLPRPALAFLRRRGARVFTDRRVRRLTIQDQRITGVATAEQVVEADHVVVAAAHHGAAALLETVTGGARLATELRRLGHQPICTVYLQYPEDTALDFPMLGLTGGLAQWVFDRRVSGRPGLMAAVISAEGPHMALERHRLAAEVETELQYHFPHWPSPRRTTVIRERHATFDCRAGVEALRPANHTSVGGLWLAGDYTRTPYPSTLEGAVMSGLQCAGEILSRQ